MSTVYPYDTVEHTAKGSYKYLYKVTPDVDKTNHAYAGITITEPMDEVVVTITNTINKSEDIRKRMVDELRYRDYLVRLELSLPIIGGWYVRIVDQSGPIYTNLNEIVNGTYNFMDYPNEGDIIIVYSGWCPSIAYNIIANPSILQSDPNQGFDFFQDTVESQIRFIDKCVRNSVVYYDNKAANQCKNKDGDVVIIDTDPHFFESDKRILNLPGFLSNYAKVVMLIIYLLVFMVNLDIFDKKYQKAPFDIKYYQQFKKYIKSNRISSITSTLLIETIDYLYYNNIVVAIRLIKHYLGQYVQICDRDELDTQDGLNKWLLHAFNLLAPVPTPTLSKLSLLNIKHATKTDRRIRNSIDMRNSNRQKTLREIREIRNIDNVVAKHNTNWLSDVWGWWYIPDNTPKEPLSSVWRIVNRGSGSRRRGRPRKMNSQKKHLNKRTHKTINASTSKSNSK